jgi:hypothetical protein
MTGWTITLTVEPLRGRLTRASQQAGQTGTQLAAGVLREVAQLAAAHTPIRSGRTVAGWNKGIELLGGNPRPISGLLVTSLAIGQGQSDVQLAQQSGKSVSSAELTHRGPAVARLEFGGGRRAPLAIVRRSVSEVSQRLPVLLAPYTWWE